jgi:hypothetical protein
MLIRTVRPWQALFAARVTSLFLCLGAGYHLNAQTAPPPPEPTGEKTAATPAKPKWTEDLTVGAQLDEGRAGTKMVNILGDVWENYGGGIIRFDIGETYGSISASGIRLTSVDRQYGAFSFTHDLSKSKRYYFTQIDSIERDTVLLIDYRASSLNALGIRFKKKKLAFDFGPGFALVDQQKNTPQIDGFKVDAGGFYSLVYNINPKWQLTQWATYRNDVSYPSDRLIDGAIALTGMITKAIGIKISSSYNYEGVLSARSLRLGFNTRNYLSTTIGVTIHHH